jgi:hypothetical protein
MRPGWRGSGSIQSGATAAASIQSTPMSRRLIVLRVLGQADHPSLAACDPRIEELAAQRFEAFERAFLIRAHQPRIPRHIGGEDRGKPAGSGRSRSSIPEWRNPPVATSDHPKQREIARGCKRCADSSDVRGSASFQADTESPWRGLASNGSFLVRRGLMKDLRSTLGRRIP